MRRTLILLIAATLVLTACGSSTTTISKAEFEAAGKDWPFTADEAELACDPADGITATIDGVVYAVNGTAKATKKYKDALDVWVRTPSGGRVDFRDIINEGLALCQ